jgi:hypothetical protein
MHDAVDGAASVSERARELASERTTAAPEATQRASETA